MVNKKYIRMTKRLVKKSLFWSLGEICKIWSVTAVRSHHTLSDHMDLIGVKEKKD